MSKLNEWQAAIAEYDRGVKAVRTITGEPDLQVELRGTSVDWQTIARQALKVALAAEAVNNVYALQKTDRDGDLICSGCGVYEEVETIHDESCPVKQLQDALREIES